MRGRRGRIRGAELAKALPYYPMYPYDFDEDEHVLPMTLDEVGLYILAMNSAWKYGSIPDDYLGLAVLIRRKPAAVKRAWEVVRARFVESMTPGRLVNPRQEVERTKAALKSGKASDAARLSHAEGVRTQSRKPANASADAERTHVRTHLQRASESVSESEFVDVFPEGSAEGNPAAVVLSPSDGWERYLGIFVAAGKPMNNKDLEKALRMWLSLEIAERLSATQDIEATCRATSEPQFIPFPVNHLMNKPWTRTGIKRVLPDPPTKGEQTTAEVMRQMRERRARAQ